MHLKNIKNWIEIVLEVIIALTLVTLGYALWYHHMDLSMATLIILVAVVILLAYLKYLKILTLKKRFVIVQETFTTLMLVCFAVRYFKETHTTADKNSLKNTRHKFDEVYDKSRYHLTIPLILTAIKTFGEIKSIKNIIKSEVEDFSSAEGFNLDNAEHITKELSVLIEKIQHLSNIIVGGFSSHKSMDEIIGGHKPTVAHPVKSRKATKKTPKVKRVAPKKTMKARGK